MNLSGLVSMAKMMLPKNSPWISRIEQAQQMAAQFSQSPDGVRQLMQQMGKTQADVQAAVQALNNPAVSGMLNRVSPGLAEQLKAAGASLATGHSSPEKTPPSTDVKGDDSLARLREKLARL